LEVYMRGLFLLVFSILSVFCGAKLAEETPLCLLQPAALLIVFGPILGCLVFYVGIAETWAALKRLVRGEGEERDYRHVSQLTSLGYTLGTVAMLVGAIHVFKNLSTPTQVGQGMAVALLGLLYGCAPAMLGALCLPLKRVRNVRAARAYLLGTAFTIFGFLFIVLSALTK
jgi:flagellar motor component MotA